jgi:long-chain acyl-CoA synthetase
MDQSEFPWIKSYEDGVDWAAELAVEPVYAMMDRAGRDHADRPAFDFLGYKLSWGALSAQVDLFAAGLQASGLKKGEPVGLLLPNCPYYVIAYFGALKAGATVVNFNPLYAEKELAHLIEDSGAEILVTLDLKLTFRKVEHVLAGTRLKSVIVCPFADVLPFPKKQLFTMLKARELARVQYTRRIRQWDDVIEAGRGHEFVLPEIDPVEDIALLQYTGGTTGTPKGAMLTHRNVVANVQQCAFWFADLKPGEQRMLAVLPFFHVFAMTAIMNLSVWAGLEIIAMPRFELEDTLKVIAKKKPHLFPAVPAIYNAINNSPKTKKYDLSSLLYCVSGGAPLPVEVKKNFEAMTGCVVVEGYGLTESSPVACVNPLKAENVAGSIGLPLPQTIVEIVDPEDKVTMMPAGERGELCIRGPQVMKGYWNKPEDSAECLRDCGDGTVRLHTGDIAIMDERGYVFIVDRLKDMIITNGYNVYPRNVEEAIYQHPSVEECIVAGIPDASRGEIVKAWIKLKDGRELIVEDLKVFLADKLSPMEIPKRYEFRNEPLPKTMIGKLSRKEVVEQELSK